MKYFLFSVLLISFCLELTFIHGCTEPEKSSHRQNLFCKSEFVFEATAKSWYLSNPQENLTEEQNAERSERIYNMDVTKTYKNGRRLFRTFTGQIMEPLVCGNTSERMRLGKKYLIFANRENGTYSPVIVSYEASLQEDVPFITHYFDCTCPIQEFALDEKEDKNDTAAENACVLSNNVTCLLYRGYCARDENNTCSWRTVDSCEQPEPEVGRNGSGVYHVSNFEMFLCALLYTTVLMKLKS